MSQLSKSFIYNKWPTKQCNAASYPSPYDCNTSFTVSMNHRNFLGGGSYGDVYNAYKVTIIKHKFFGYHLKNEKTYVAKIGDESIKRTREVNHITNQFYETNGPYAYGHNAHITFTSKLGDINLAAICQDDHLRRQYNLHELPQQMTAILQLLMQLAQMHANTSHNQPTIHLDIKPDNIIISDDGVFSLTDFDLSIRVSEHDKTVYLPNFYPALSYSASETVHDTFGFSYISDKVDIFSMVGVILGILGKEDYFKPENHDYFNTRLDFDELWNDDKFDFTKQVERYLNIMQHKVVAKRPDAQQALRFFQLAATYCQIKGSLYKYSYDKSSLDQTDLSLLQNNDLNKQLKSLKAQIIMLSQGVWNKPIWYNYTLTDLEHYPFYKDDFFCEQIIQNQDQITPERIMTYFALKAFNNDIPDSIVDPAGPKISDNQYRAIAGIATVLSPHQDINPFNYYIQQALQNDYDEHQMLAFSLLNHIELNDGEAHKLLRHIDQDQLTQDQIETTAQLINNGYKVEPLIDYILPFRDSSSPVSENELNKLGSYAQRTTFYRLPELFSELFQDSQKYQVFQIINSRFQQSHKTIPPELYDYLISDNNASVQIRDLLIQNSGSRFLTRIISDLKTVTNLLNMNPSIKTACLNVISANSGSQLCDILYNLYCLAHYLSDEDSNSQNTRQLLIDHTESENLSTIIINLNVVKDYLDRPDVTRPDWAYTDFCHLYNKIITPLDEHNRTIASYFPSITNKLRQNIINGLAQQLAYTHNLSKQQTIFHYLYSELVKQRDLVTKQHSGENRLSSLFSNPKKHQINAINELLNIAAPNQTQYKRLSPNEDNNPTNEYKQPLNASPPPYKYSQAINMLTKQDDLLGVTAKAVQDAHEKLSEPHLSLTPL